MSDRVPGLVSTVIPVHDRPTLLRHAVESVLAQTYRPIEIVVVDDGSTDATPDVIAEFCAAHAGTVRSVRIDNSGPGVAREAGRALVRGEFVQYLDSDDLLLPGKFEVQVDTLRGRPECGVVYGLTRLVEDAGKTVQERYMWTGAPLERLYPYLLVAKAWTTQNPLYRRDVTDRVGSWAPMRIGEDWEYDARVGALDVPVAFCDVEVSCHRTHGGVQLTDGRWSRVDKLKDYVALIESLHRGAAATAVPADTPEMRHFTRWAFATARAADEAGLRQPAERSLAAARWAAGPARGERLRLAAYRLFASVVGWRRAAVLGESLMKAVRNEP